MNQMQFHWQGTSQQRVLAGRVASHLQLTMENIARFSWLLAGSLSKDAGKAREAAREAQRYLLSTATKNPFAQAMLEDEVLMQEIGMFCDYDPPALLWHANGLFKNLARIFNQLVVSLIRFRGYKVGIRLI